MSDEFAGFAPAPIRQPQSAQVAPAAVDEFAGFKPLVTPARARAVTTANDNADEAGKAINVGKRLGVPPALVQGDVPGYSAAERQQSAAKAVEDPAIAKYVEGNPIASQVSADDYDNLSDFSRAMKAIGRDSVDEAAHRQVVNSIPELAELMSTGPGREKLLGVVKNLPATLFADVAETTLSGLQGAAMGLAAPGLRARGPQESFWGGFINQFKDVGSVGMGAVGVATAPFLPVMGAIKTVVARPLAVAEGIPVAQAEADVGKAMFGLSPRSGLKPGGAVPTDVEAFLGELHGRQTRAEIDDFLRERATADQGPVLQITKAQIADENLTAVVEAAQQSKTKARSPELFEEAAAAHGDDVVNVPASKIVELYEKEGKTPAEGDGLFGFVPDLENRLRLATETGGEITIPLSKYVAHIDPTVHEGMRADVRLHDDGVSVAEAEAAIEAWHGTPHDFESFDLTKIGTGEGAQAYGHGLYFAEQKSVGAEYRDSLSEQKLLINGWDPLLSMDDNIANAGEWLEKHKGDLKTALAKRKNPNDDVSKVLESWKDKEVRFISGNLYKVKINADPTKFLDWDKPLAEQSQHVKNVLAKEGITDPSTEGFFLYQHFKEKWAGDKLPDTKADHVAESAGASKMLAEAGIPGIKYLDQGSRGLNPDGIKLIERDLEAARKAGNTDKIATLEKELSQLKATRNFVVFDDKLVKIIEKNGNPIVEAVIEAAVKAKKENFLTPLFTDAKSVGITDAEFGRYAAKIDKMQENILSRAIELNQRQIAQSLTAEWKRNQAQVTEEVTRELTDAGGFAAEKYLRENKIDISENLGATDELAPLFGFETGRDLRNALIDIAEDDRAPQVQLREAIKAEAARRMEERYGNVREEIAIEASEIALADYTLDILADEVSILARAAGMEPPLSKTELTAWVKNEFERSNIVGAANWEAHRKAIQRGGREAEKALLKGDFKEAFKAKQRQFLASITAKESMRLQKLIDRTEKKIDRFSTEPTIKAIEQTHLEQIRSVLERVGVEQQHAPTQSLADLGDFVVESDGQLSVADWLTARDVPQIKDMTVAQFREFADSLKSMEHVGRQVNKLISARGEAELQNVVFDAVKELERFPFVDQPKNPGPLSYVKSGARRFVGAHLLVEKMFDYTDRMSPHGPLTTYIDRPLRDANSKELELTEKVTKALRDLYPQSEDAGLTELIPNTLIPDTLSKTGFMQMNRQNLRQLMLYTGDRVRMAKVSEGFGVNEADVRRFIDANATAKDVAWVNGIWKIFKELKPEADAVHLRDTGVPVDETPAAPWTVKAGELTGGYYPIRYDPMNSNIKGHIASQTSLFDKGYQSASTPKSYTREVTQFKGALDLEGNFLASSIRGMVHDIAFREAVRSVNRLITNQEFRTAVAQYWGREYAELMEPWLKSIANSHNLDADYAQGITRAMAIIRQNVVATLINFNPSTVIKHGFTAMVMSGSEVGFKPLVKEMAALGAKGAGKIAKDLVVRDDVVPDEDFMEAFRETITNDKRGEEIRNFVLQSSPTMRNRSRKVDDSIAGAIRVMDREGASGAFTNVRDANMLYGRFAVAFFDQLSTVPTWYAAYKRAYLAGESHEGSVFLADKAVSRAHGSTFTGDQPAVTRLPNTFLGELGRWFVPLYKFYNHYANANFQFAWDAAATLRGPKPGEAQEPGANAARLSKHVLQALAIIFIEEQSSAALSEDKKGFLHSMLLKAGHLFGGFFVGTREITGMLTHGYGPSSGLLGTLGKALDDTLKDIKKSTTNQARLSKDWIIHTATALGFATGLGGAQLGRTGSFAADLATGKERITGAPLEKFNKYRQGFRTGHSKAKVH